MTPGGRNGFYYKPESTGTEDMAQRLGALVHSRRTWVQFPALIGNSPLPVAPVSGGLVPSTGLLGVHTQAQEVNHFLNPKN